jgi:hypothetical protein
MVASGLILISLVSFAQESRFIELTVSDTVVLKSIGYTYQIDIGQQFEFMGLKIPQDNNDQDKPTTSITEVTDLLKKGNFPYSLSSEKNYSLSGSSTQPSILIDVTTENELKSLTDLLKQQPGISGKIKEVKYESMSKYHDQIYNNLYVKALRQATLLANISGNSIGALLSISEAKSSTNDYLDMYNQILKIMPVKMQVETNVFEKSEEIKMVFKFELK